MGDLTANLSRYEFACKCGCGYDTVDFDLPQLLQEGRDHFQIQNPSMNLIININRGASCPTHNKEVGGKPEETTWFGKAIFLTGSQHLYGKAADFNYEDTNSGKIIAPAAVYAYFDRRFPLALGIGIYKGRNHIDTRSVRARWDNR